MKFLRSVAGHRRLNMRRNEDIRKERIIFKLNDKIEEYRVNWLEHVERMNRERAPKVLLKQTQGKKIYGQTKVGVSLNRTND
ncbi:hypothetical protein C0J52_04740 [Blattella germanica]|nr:hypothetical protein C0J52_04740 [Blattella germanica]